MEDIYQLFKMIFGLISSAFILYLLVLFAGLYGGGQESLQKDNILDNFGIISQSVYTSGNPINFTQFSIRSFESLDFDSDSQDLEGDSVKKTIFLPLLFHPGNMKEPLYISRVEMDMGWMGFYMVEAVPEMEIIINPVSDKSSALEIAYDVVSMLPDTSYESPKVTFYLCDGGRKLSPCAGKCEAFDFKGAINSLRSSPQSFSRCTLDIKDNQRLLVLDDTCSQGSEGVCVIPYTDGLPGWFYIEDSQRGFIYKDALDIVAPLIAGNLDTINGNQAENYYDYKNRKFAEIVSLTAMVKSGKAGKLRDEIPVQSPCVQVYESLEAKLRELETMLSVKDYQKSMDSSRRLVEKLGEIYVENNNLKDKGCELR